MQSVFLKKVIQEYKNFKIIEFFFALTIKKKDREAMLILKTSSALLFYKYSGA